MLNSESLFRELFHRSRLGMIAINQQRDILECNQAFGNLLGVSTDELQGRSISEIIDPDSLGDIEDVLWKMSNGQAEHHQTEVPVLDKEGRPIWFRLWLTLVRDADGTPKIIGLLEDLSAQKELEADLAEIEHALLDKREERLVELARDIHDGPLQSLFGLNIQLHLVEHMIMDKSIITQLNDIHSLVLQVIQMLRYIYEKLTPATFSHFHLKRATRMYAEQISLSHPEVQFTIDIENDNEKLPERVHFAFFLILQKCLMNALTHSHARRITLRMQDNSEEIRFEISDDGRGFEVPEYWIDFLQAGRFGLLEASERAEAVGGKLHVRSQPGQGTTITTVVERDDENLFPPRRSLSNQILRD